MLELIGFDKLFRIVGNTYFLIGLGLAVLAAWRLDTWRDRLLAAGVVLGLFGWFPVKWSLEQRAEAEAFAARRAEAVARMEVLCEKAGEFIHRTAEGVDGLFLMKLRPTDFNERNQWAVDPYGRDGDEQWVGLGKPKDRVPEGYVTMFLRATDEDGSYIGTTQGAPPGFVPRFAYVDLIDPVDGMRYRYTKYAYVPEHLKNNPNYTGDAKSFGLKREPVTPDMALPRYGVTFDDITEHEDRARWWIAGSSLRVIDLETGEVVGERIGYVVDPYIGEGGSYTNWRTIMGWGKKCPERLNSPTWQFVEKVVKPREVKR